jgi:uncharacterized membrane protein YqjE
MIMSDMNRRPTNGRNHGDRRRSGGLEGIKPAFERLTNGLSTLVKQHLELARHEVKQDVKTTGTRVGIIAACAVIGLVGYIMLLAAGVLFAGWLGGWLAAWITAGAEALANLALAGGLATYFGKKLRDDKPVNLAQTNDELDEDKRWLRAIGETSPKAKTQTQISQEQLPPS